MSPCAFHSFTHSIGQRKEMASADHFRCFTSPPPPPLDQRVAFLHWWRNRFDLGGRKCRSHYYIINVAPLLAFVVFTPNVCCVFLSIRSPLCLTLARCCPFSLLRVCSQSLSYFHRCLLSSGCRIISDQLIIIILLLLLLLPLGRYRIFP